MKNEPAPEHIASRLSYDPETGVIVWRTRVVEQPMHNQWNATWAGKSAGHLEADGYFRIGMSGRHFHSSRIAWCLAYGRWPNGVVDHINGCPSDNRLCNLREATISQNTHNQRLNKNNRCGIKGVKKLGHRDLWIARIAINRIRRTLGYFKTREEAASAYAEAARKLHGEFARLG